jgi:fumarylacetoacetase
VKADDAVAPGFRPTRLLDIELEVGFVTGPSNALGEPIPIRRARDHIFGLVLVNDWSARDIQKWEYVPLGPFLGKSFATSISPWVVPLEALEPFRVQPPPQDPAVLPHLREGEPGGYDLDLEVWLQPAGASSPTRISRTSFRRMYWTMAQQLAHQTGNGTNIRPGDLYASGTVSGPDPGSYGSLIELTWRGTRPLQLPGGLTRTFLEDGDTVILRGGAEGDGYRIGFGECRGTILPSLPEGHWLEAGASGA